MRARTRAFKVALSIEIDLVRRKLQMREANAIRIAANMAAVQIAPRLASKDETGGDARKIKCNTKTIHLERARHNINKTYPLMLISGRLASRASFTNKQRTARASYCGCGAAYSISWRDGTICAAEERICGNRRHRMQNF